MQFFLFDLALTFAALLGYRAVEAVVRRGAPVASLARRAPTIRTISGSENRQFRKAVPSSTAPAQRVPPRRVSQARLHRLINFW
jgi:hypothetical protein